MVAVVCVRPVVEFTAVTSAPAMMASQGARVYEKLSSYQWDLMSSEMYARTRGGHECDYPCSHTPARKAAQSVRTLVRL